MPSDGRSTAGSILERFGLDGVHPWVFLVHAAVAMGAVAIGVFGLLNGSGAGAVFAIGAGVMILVLGRSAGRLAYMR